MKYIKLIIILLVIVGIIFGLYKLNTGGIDGPDDIIGDHCKKCETIEEKIENKIENASNSSFCTKDYDDILKTIDLFFEDEPSNKATHTMKLQGAYSRKFVQQANFVFDGSTWRESDIRIIRREVRKCKEFFPDDPDLLSIDVVLKNYDDLKNFDSKVKLVCSQKPKCLNDPIYLYLLDDWDVSKTNGLLSSIPSYSGKVVNSPIYKNTRKEQVATRLKNAHKRFIDEKVKRSEEEAEGYNHNPARYNDYSKLGEYLYKCFNTYHQLWGERELCLQWQIAVRNWENYVLEQDEF